MTTSDPQSPAPVEQQTQTPTAAPVKVTPPAVTWGHMGAGVIGLAIGIGAAVGGFAFKHKGDAPARKPAAAAVASASASAPTPVIPQPVVVAAKPVASGVAAPAASASATAPVKAAVSAEAAPAEKQTEEPDCTLRTLAKGEARAAAVFKLPIEKLRVAFCASDDSPAKTDNGVTALRITGIEATDDLTKAGRAPFTAFARAVAEATVGIKDPGECKGSAPYTALYNTDGKPAALTTCQQADAKTNYIEGMLAAHYAGCARPDTQRCIDDPRYKEIYKDPYGTGANQLNRYGEDLGLDDLRRDISHKRAPGLRTAPGK
jgi:hypothetical protein